MKICDMHIYSECLARELPVHYLATKACRDWDSSRNLPHQGELSHRDSNALFHKHLSIGLFGNIKQ